MAIDRTGIDSLNAGAPDLRLEGDVAEIQAIPIEIQNKILEYWIQQGSGSPADRIEDVPKEFRDRILQLFKKASAEEAPTGYDEYRLNELKNQRLPEPPEWYNKEIEMAYGGTARPTYTQSRKQRINAAGGGIMGSNAGSMLVAPTADGSRPGYGLLSDIKDKIADLIPNEIKDPIMNNPLLATLGGGALLNQFGLPVGIGSLEKGAGQNWIGELLGKIPGTGGTIDMVLGKQSGPQYQTLGEGIKSIFTGGAALPPQLGGSGTLQDATEYAKRYLTDYVGKEFGLNEQDIERQKQLNQQRELQKINWEVPLAVGAGAHEYQKQYLADQPKFPMDETGFDVGATQRLARITPEAEAAAKGLFFTPQDKYRLRSPTQEQAILGAAEGGRIGAQEGGLMNLGGMEKDYRQEGGFVPIGGQEKADDVPARLSKNEFVFTADAVRAAGGGDIDKGAEIMENLMENLEAGGKVSEESQGLEGAQEMFANAQQLEKRII